MLSLTACSFTFRIDVEPNCCHGAKKSRSGFSLHKSQVFLSFLSMESPGSIFLGFYIVWFHISCSVILHLLLIITQYWSNLLYSCGFTCILLIYQLLLIRFFICSRGHFFLVEKQFSYKLIQGSSPLQLTFAYLIHVGSAILTPSSINSRGKRMYFTVSNFGMTKF